MGAKWKRSKKWFSYKWGGVLRHYNPDFVVLDNEGHTKKYIEVKGWYREGEYPRIKAKLLAVRGLGYRIELWRQKKIEKFESSKQYRERISEIKDEMVKDKKYHKIATSRFLRSTRCK